VKRPSLDQALQQELKLLPARSPVSYLIRKAIFLFFAALNSTNLSSLDYDVSGKLHSLLVCYSI